MVNIVGLAFVGIIGAFLINALANPKGAYATGEALGSTGTGISQIGTGIGDSIRSIGTSLPKMFDFLFTLRDLAFSSDVAGAANVSPTAQVSGETNQGNYEPSSSTITWSGGTSSSGPSGSYSTGGGAPNTSLAGGGYGW